MVAQTNYGRLADIVTKIEWSLSLQGKCLSLMINFQLESFLVRQDFPNEIVDDRNESDFGVHF